MPYNNFVEPAKVQILNTQNLLFADVCLFVLNKEMRVTQFTPCSQSNLQLSVKALQGTDFLSCITESEKNIFKRSLVDVFETSESIELDAMACDQNSKITMYRWKISKQGSEIFILGRELKQEKIDRDTIHEINNPLTVIHTRSYQLQQMADNNELSTDKIKHFAESIHAAAIKIANILKSNRK